MCLAQGAGRYTWLCLLAQRQMGVHSFSTINTPPVYELIEVETHRTLRALEDNSTILERMQSLSCEPVEFLKLEISDDVAFDAWMLKPKAFDPSKKYPLFIYVYGEPHAQTVLNEWELRRWIFIVWLQSWDMLLCRLIIEGTPCPKGAAGGDPFSVALVPFRRRIKRRTKETRRAIRIHRYRSRGNLGVEWWWIEYAERFVSQARFVSSRNRSRPQASAAFVQRLVPRDLHAHSRGQSGWIRTICAHELCSGLKGNLLIITVQAKPIRIFRSSKAWSTA